MIYTALNIFFFLNRKTILKQKSTTVDKSKISRSSVSNTEQNDPANTASNYQELCVSENENNYQTLHQY